MQTSGIIRSAELVFQGMLGAPAEQDVAVTSRGCSSNIAAVFSMGQRKSTWTSTNVL